jgi:Zn ribbon nucleic-acid-binding protein
MSEMRRKRQEERQSPPSAARRWRKIGIVVAILAVAFGIYYLVFYIHSHRYDAFARCLAEKQVKMYGAYWCPHCSEQKEMFGASFNNVPYVECGIPGQRGETQECKDMGIKRFPTWVFPATATSPQGDRQERIIPLEELSSKTGCALP